MSGAVETAWVLLHGNPGTGDDLEALGAALAAGGGAVARPTRPLTGAHLGPILADAEHAWPQSDAQRILLGYSWGAWLALHVLLGASRRPHGVVLVNPYLVVESPLSPVVRALVATPFLGRFLMKRSLQKMVPEYIDKTFAPAAPPAEAKARMEKALWDPALWKGAVAYKSLQQRVPRAHLEDVPAPLLVIRGEGDQVGAWEVQRGPLERVLAHDRVTVKTIEGAGHGLPWTHQDALVEHINGWRESL